MMSDARHMGLHVWDDETAADNPPERYLESSRVLSLLNVSAALTEFPPNLWIDHIEVQSPDPAYGFPAAAIEKRIVGNRALFNVVKDFIV